MTYPTRIPMPKKLHPLVASLGTKAAEEAGIPFEAILGPNRTKRKKAVEARHGIIVQLWAERKATRGQGFKWAQSDIAREVGMDNTSIHHALVKAGVHTPKKRAKAGEQSNG